MKSNSMVLLSFFSLFCGAPSAHAEHILAETCGTSQEAVVCFTSFLDMVLQIWEDTCLLSNSDIALNEREMIGDLVLGRLTRLKHDISTLEQQSRSSHMAMMTDLEYVIAILRKIEEEFLAHDRGSGRASLVPLLARAIREQIVSLVR